MRAIEKKRPPFMNRRRWILLIIIVLILLVVGISFLYRAIHEGIWQEKDEIKQMIEQSNTYDLDTIELLNKYVWEDVYWIMLADKAEDGEATYSVWSKEALLAELTYRNAVAEDTILASVQQQKANASDIKLQVGYGFGQFVWEVKYRDNETSHMKIAFYSLSNGSFIDEYTIPREARP